MNITVKVIALIQETFLILYTIQYFWKLFRFENLSIDNFFAILLIWGAYVLCFLMIIFVILNRKLYWNAILFRLGFILVLLIYMFLNPPVCDICLISHALVVVFSSLILTLNYILNKYKAQKHV